MTRQEFMKSVKDGHVRSLNVLIDKEDEYSESEGNRLQQFYDGADPDTNPCEVLIGMARKHWTSICMMAKHPGIYSLDKWREKTTDLRNYTHLLDALLEEL